jgi:2-methylisocitrate lyase-like PEP mutase family enzyme
MEEAMTEQQQRDRGERFRALHARPGAFVMPNPWDVGTARILAHLGFEALATTSAGMAFALGRHDNSVAREVVLGHAATIAAATDLPVSADLERGFGDAPAEVAETVRLAATTGIVGGSVEDRTGRPDRPVYELAHAADRVRAAVEAARALPVPFTLTARAENFVVGRPDLADTIARLEAFEDAGADVLYAPGLTSADDVATVVRAVGRPVNVLMGVPGTSFTVAELAGLGVGRVSVGSGLARVALGAFMRAAAELATHGTLETAAGAARARDFDAIFER